MKQEEEKTLQRKVTSAVRRLKCHVGGKKSENIIYSLLLHANQELHIKTVDS